MPKNKLEVIKHARASASKYKEKATGGKETGAGKTQERPGRGQTDRTAHDAAGWSELDAYFRLVVWCDVNWC